MTFEITEKLLNSTDGTQIYATAVGNNKLDSLVFVHGFALTAAVFANLFQNQDLLKRFYLVAYDMRGHGRSGKPDTLAGHASPLYAADFAAVVKAFSLKSPVLVGWSIGATVAADIFANLPISTLSGVIYAAGLPFIGPEINAIGTPFMLGLLPGLIGNDNVTLALSSKSTYVDSLFIHPAAVPVSLKWAWLGSAALQPPEVSGIVFSRVQNSTGLFAAGEKGFPLLMLYGSADNQVQGSVVKGIIEPHFTNSEYYEIQGGSHASFYDQEAEFVGQVVTFATKVFSSHKKTF